MRVLPVFLGLALGIYSRNARFITCAGVSKSQESFLEVD